MISNNMDLMMELKIYKEFKQELNIITEIVYIILKGFKLKFMTKTEKETSQKFYNLILFSLIIFKELVIINHFKKTGLYSIYRDILMKIN